MNISIHQDQKIIFRKIIDFDLVISSYFCFYSDANLYNILLQSMKSYYYF